MLEGFTPEMKKHEQKGIEDTEALKEMREQATKANEALHALSKLLRMKEETDDHSPNCIHEQQSFQPFGSGAPEVQQQLTKMREELNEANERVRLAEEEVGALEKEFILLKRTLSVCGTEKSQLERQYNALRQEHEKMAKELERMKEEKKQVESEKEEIEQELKAKNDELSETKQELEMTKKGKQELEEEMNKTTEEVSETKKEVEELKKQLEKEKEMKKTQELRERIKKLEEENQLLKDKEPSEEDEEQDKGMKAETHYEMNNDMVNAPSETQGSEDHKNVFGMARKNCTTEEIIEMIEREGLDINRREEETNQTLLHIGAQTGNVELCKWLIEQVIEVRAKDKNENMAIHIASYYGKSEVVELLAEHDKETVNQKNMHGNTPLHCLVNGRDMTPEDRMNVFRVLKNHGADTTLTNNKKETILQRAIVNEGMNKGYEYGQDIIDQLMDDMKEQKATYANHRGETSLYTAAFFGNKRIVQGLCEAHACVSDADEEGWQPLHAAASMGHEDCCEILLENGADVNSETKKGTTPALVASQTGHVRVLEVLVSHQADLNKANEDGWCPIHGASVHGHVEEVKYLISHGVEVNVCEKKHHHTPLMMCILSHEFNGEVERALLGAGADWTIRSVSGNTSLHACTVRDNVEAAQILIDYPDLKPPMNMNIMTMKEPTVKGQTVRGLTTLQLCRINNAPDLAKFLSERLGVRTPYIGSSQRSKLSYSTPASPPQPSVSEAPGDTPRTNRCLTEEPKQAPPPQTPPRAKPHNPGGNKTFTTSERKSTPTSSKKPPSPNNRHTWK